MKYVAALTFTVCVPFMYNAFVQEFPSLALTLYCDSYMSLGNANVAFNIFTPKIQLSLESKFPVILFAKLHLTIVFFHDFSLCSSLARKCVNKFEPVGWISSWLYCILIQWASQFRAGVITQTSVQSYV